MFFLCKNSMQFKMFRDIDDDDDDDDNNNNNNNKNSYVHKITALVSSAFSHRSGCRRITR